MRRKALLLGLFLFLVSWTASFAQDQESPGPVPLTLSDDKDKYPLGLHLELLEDATGTLTIDDVSSAGYADRFAPSQVAVPNLGFTDSAYWVRFKPDNQSRLTNRWLLDIGFANMQFVDLYVPLGEDSGFIEKQTGTLRPLESRDILHPHIVLELSIPADSEETFYLRFQNGASMTLPLTLWEPKAFSSSNQSEQLQQGIFFGVMFGLLAYNLFLLLSLRERSYFFLALFLAAMIFFESTYSGYTELYLIPRFYSLKPYYQPLSFAILFVAILLFSDIFLELNTRLPALHKVYWAILGIWVVLTVLIPFVDYHTMAQFMIPCGLLTLAVSLLAGIVSWYKDFRPARYFMIAWLGFVPAFFITILVRSGVIQSTAFTEGAYRLGVIWMAVCWSIALADRINLLQEETESTNRRLESTEYRLTQTLEAMPVAVVVYGPDEKPIFMNRRTAEILTNESQGMMPDLSAGRTLAEAMTYFSFRIVGSEQAYPIDEMPVQRALQGEPASADNIEADLVDRRIPIEVWASPVWDEDGKIESAVVAFQDISVRKQQELELEEYRQHLESLVRERTHELNITNERLRHEASERVALEELLQKRITWMSKFGLARQGMRGSADLSATLDNLSAVILEILDAQSLFFLTWDGPDQTINLLCGPVMNGRIPSPEELAAPFSANTPLRGQLESGKRVVLSVDEATSMPEPFLSCFDGHGMQTLILSPLSDGESVAGVLGVALDYLLPELDPAQNELVTKVAHDVAQLAQDARYLDQSRALVAGEERNRLARDLHDSVTQVLFSASLVAEVLPQIWHRDPEKGVQSLEELRQLTHGALAEMRTMLLELRPAAVAKAPLAELLSQLTEASTSRSGLRFHLYIEQAPRLPERVHYGFYRIAQEALNNVVKHARATEVIVRLSNVSQESDAAGRLIVDILLVIEDDGIGFATSDAVEHLGMGIMRERAADIQASLTIESEIDQGTRVTLLWCGAVEDEA